jgi:hypothetical protein
MAGKVSGAPTARGGALESKPHRHITPNPAAVNRSASGGNLTLGAQRLPHCSSLAQGFVTTQGSKIAAVRHSPRVVLRHERHALRHSAPARVECVAVSLTHSLRRVTRETPNRSAALTRPAAFASSKENEAHRRSAAPLKMWEQVLLSRAHLGRACEEVEPPLEKPKPRGLVTSLRSTPRAAHKSVTGGALASVLRALNLAKHRER